MDPKACCTWDHEYCNLYLPDPASLSRSFSIYLSTWTISEKYSGESIHKSLRRRVNRHSTLFKLSSFQRLVSSIETIDNVMVTENAASIVANRPCQELIAGAQTHPNKYVRVHHTKPRAEREIISDRKSLWLLNGLGKDRDKNRYTAKHLKEKLRDVSQTGEYMQCMKNYVQ